MRIALALLLGAAAVTVSACATTLPQSANASDRDLAGCRDDGGYSAGYNIPICTTTNDASLWPR